VTEADGVTVTPSDEGFAMVAGERRLGGIPVLLVRMNVDLLMGEDLKKSGAGNLFTVFGEPDIELRTIEDGRVVVEIRGVDVYDPTTGEVRSSDTGQIALWMIDTSYNEESLQAIACGAEGRHRRRGVGDALSDRVAAVRPTGDRQDRRQGHQRLRR